MKGKVKPLDKEEKPSKGVFSKIFSKKKKEINHRDVEEESMLEDMTGTSEEFLDEEGLWSLGDIKKDLEALEVKDESIENEYTLDLTHEDMVKAEEPIIGEKPSEWFGEEFELEDLLKEPGIEEIKESSEVEEGEEILETLGQEELQDILKEVEGTEKEGLEMDLEEIGKEAFPSELTPEIEGLKEISLEDEISFEIEKDEVPEEISFEFEETPEIAKPQTEESKEEKEISFEFEEISERAETHTEEFKEEELEEISLGYEEATSPEIEVSPEIEMSLEPGIAGIEEEPEEIKPVPIFALEEREEASILKRDKVIFSQATQDAIEKTVRQAMEDITMFLRDTIKDTIEKVSYETIPKVIEKHLRK